MKNFHKKGKLEKIMHTVEEGPYTRAVLFLKPPLASIWPLRFHVYEFLVANGYTLLRALRFPNNLEVWEALYPDFEPSLLKALYEFSKDTSNNPYARILSALNTTGRAGFILLLLERNREPHSTSPAILYPEQERLKEIQGPAEHLNPALAQNKCSLRAYLIQQLLKRCLVQSADDSTAKLCIPFSTRGNFDLIDGLVHVPDPDDKINTLKRLKASLSNTCQGLPAINVMI